MASNIGNKVFEIMLLEGEYQVLDSTYLPMITVGSGGYTAIAAIEFLVKKSGIALTELVEGENWPDTIQTVFDTVASIDCGTNNIVSSKEVFHG